MTAADLPKCQLCQHYLAIHGRRGCVAAIGCPCRRKGSGT